MIPIPHNLLEAYRTDAIVHQILRDDGSLEECVIALTEERKRLTARICELEMIAPKKMRWNDGAVRIWHCPDELVPMSPNTLTES